MPPKSNNNQREHFDKVTHRFSLEKILSPSLSNKKEIEQIIKLLDLPLGAKIVDFGCGSGRITIPLLKKGYDVLGVDISCESLTSLDQFYKKNRQTGWGKLFLSTTLPLKEKYDAVVGADILHHISISKYSSVFKQILKPKGKILFSEPNAFHLLWYAFIFVNLDWSIEKGILQCTPIYLNDTFKKSGFDKVRVYGHGFLPTMFFNFFSPLHRFNIKAGNFPIIKLFAFRNILLAEIN